MKPINKVIFKNKCTILEFITTRRLITYDAKNLIPH